MKKTFALLGAAMLLAGSARAVTSSLDFHVVLNTAGITGSAPFNLLVELNDGAFSNADLSSVSLSNFSFVGGSATGSASLDGNASGNWTSGASLSTLGGTQFNSVFQGFGAGVTSIGFDVHVLTDLDGFVPKDRFQVSIIDSTDYLGTNDPQNHTAFLVLDIGQGMAFGNVAAFSGSGVSASVSAVPEPSAYGLMGAGVAAAVAIVRRRRKAA